MNPIFVDGIAADLGQEAQHLTSDAPLQDVLRVVRRQFNSGSGLICEIRVDGIELSELDEKRWNSRPVSQFGQIEVFTSPRQEFVRDTLLNLLGFTTELERLCRLAAPDAREGRFGDDYLRLVDGIGLFTETLSHVKRMLKTGLLPAVWLLEADLLSLSRDMLSAQEGRTWEYLGELLETHLTENLAQWRERGIPLLQDLR